MSESKEDLSQAWNKTTFFLQMLEMSLDYQKSWAWDNKPRSGNFDHDLQLQKLQNARDLGANIRYGKMRSTKLFKSREEQA